MTSPNSTDESLLKTLLQEHSVMTANIQGRVDLQNKNLSLLLVLSTAIAGYMVNKWNATNFNEFVVSEVVVLCPVAVLLQLVFIWRHLDHDANIIAAAEYLEINVCPEVARLTNSATVLTFESYLRSDRGQRTRRIGVLSLLGNDHFVAFGVSLAFLMFSWYLRIFESNHAGTADHVFDWLVYFGSAMFILTSFMAVTTMLRFSKIPSLRPGSASGVGGAVGPSAAAQTTTAAPPKAVQSAVTAQIGSQSQKGRPRQAQPLRGKASAQPTKSPAQRKTTNASGPKVKGTTQTNSPTSTPTSSP
jgi:hypothetical protein